jgi:fermentation-respiration switch protein FrsA (DUF1100 family)
VSIAAITAVLAVFLWTTAERTALYPAPPAGDGEDALRASGGERLWLGAGDSRVEAWKLPPLVASESPSPAILFAHGQSELVDHWALAFDEPRKEGFSVLLVEYPGYGRSGGSPSEASVLAAMRAAFDAAAGDPTIDPQRIVGWGRSLGGGAVAALSRERPLAALVLESSFTSVPDMASKLGVPPSLLRDRYDSVGALGAFPGPVLVVHGERDDVVPVAHARRIADASTRAEVEILACGHNDCPRPWERVRSFLAANGLLRPVAR